MTKTLCLDFDGVMNLYTGWKGEEELFEPRPGLKEFLEKLVKTGWQCVINSTRAAARIEKWLDKYCLSDYIQAVVDKKPPAMVYLDDRGLTFIGDFDVAFEAIQNFKTFWAM